MKQSVIKRKIFLLLIFFIIIINDPAEGLRPAGKEFSHVEITDDILLSMYPKYFHYYKIFYGNKILVQKEE